MDSSVFIDKKQVPVTDDLESSKVYAKGRGIRIPVSDNTSLKDIFKLIDFKLAF